MFTILVSITASSLIGFLIRLSLTLSKQRWAGTYHFTLTCLLLPAITFVITKVIAGNIALSLGMIGALSIVRFRNPVKSSLELTIYFLLITIGIACSVDILWAILLGGGSILLIILLHLIREKVTIKNLFFFNPSFEEGESNYLVEFKFRGSAAEFLKDNNVVTSLYDKQSNETSLKLNFKKKENAISFVENIKNDENLIFYELRF